MSDLIGVSLAVASVVAAFTAVGVSGWQGHLQRQQLKQNLYERRLAVFLATMKFLSDIAIKPRIEFSQPIQLFRETVEAEFLFDQDIVDFITEVSKKASDLRTESQVSAQENTPEAMRRQMTAERNQLERWLVVDAFRIAKEKFRPYLKLH